MITLHDFLNALQETNSRGIAVLEEEAFRKEIDTVANFSKDTKVLLVTRREDIKNEVSKKVNIECIRHRDFLKVLGNEYSHVIVDLTQFEKLSPNMICVLSETLRARGSLILVVKNFEQWRPGRFGENYNIFIKERIKKCEAHIIVLSNGSVLSYSMPKRKLELPKIEEFTKDQNDVIREYKRFIESKDRTLVVKGGRGRGKTYLLGYMAGDILYRFKYPVIDLYTPLGRAPESFMRGFEQYMLKALSCKVVREGRKLRAFDYVVRVKRPYEKIETPIVLVDEAAQVGISRIRKFISRCYKVILTVTTFGYEGCGKSFEYLLVSELQKLSLGPTLELHEPVRYCRDDPLERWLYETFSLATTRELKVVTEQIQPETLVFEEVDRRRLAQDKNLLRQIVEILRDAHYRHSPDDIEVLLDSSDHRLFTLRKNNEILAVAQIRVERPTKSEVKKATSGVILAGLALSTLLARFASSGIGGFRIWRIYRIAVRPEYQRRGLGSYLLSKIEECARRENVDIIGALFSRPEITHFWIRNGYKVFYISPRFNKVTGEHNVGVVKGLTERGQHVVKLALQDFKRRLVILASSTYREIDGELIAEILYNLDVTCPLKIGISSHAQRRVEIFEKNFESFDIEYVQDVVYAKLIEHITCNEKITIPYREFVALVIKVLQGKSTKEVAASLKVGLETARKILRRAALYVLFPEKVV